MGNRESTALKNTFWGGQMEDSSACYCSIVDPLRFPLRWEGLVGIIKVSFALKIIRVQLLVLLHQRLLINYQIGFLVLFSQVIS